MRPLLSLAAAILALGGVTAPARGDEIPVQVAEARCAAMDVGPRTTYGETHQESAAKRVVFAWACGVLVQDRVEEAFARYVSKDFCDHSHMATAGLKPCAGYDEVMHMFARMASMLRHNGKIEFPVTATVDGEMVSQWGAGVDIFRVHDGKITDHWDASPVVDVRLTAHDKAFSDRMQAQIDQGRRLPGGPMPPPGQ